MVITMVEAGRRGGGRHARGPGAVTAAAAPTLLLLLLSARNFLKFDTAFCKQKKAAYASQDFLKRAAP